jgi:hypothetical protein
MNNDEMKGAMGMRLENPFARNWFCRKANCLKWHDWPARYFRDRKASKHV